jgi:hypothetical protein
MMADRDTIAVLAEELGSAIEPVALALDSPENFAAFMRILGWDVATIPAGLSALGPAVQAVTSILEGGEIDASTAGQLIGAVGAVITAVNDLSGQPAGNFPPGLDVAAFKSEFPLQLVNFLIVEYLLDRLPEWGQLLRLLGMIRIQRVAAASTRLAYTRYDIAWNDLANVLNDPAAIMRNAYKWGDSGFLGETLLANVDALFEAWGLPRRMDRVDPLVETYLNTGAIPGATTWAMALKMPLIEETASDVQFDLGVELFLLPETATDKPGFALMPFAHGAANEEIPLSDELSLTLSGEADFAGGIAAQVRPNKPIAIVINIIPAAGSPPPPASAELSIGLLWRPSSGAEIVLLGSREGSRLRASSASIKAGGRIDSSGKKDIFFECDLTHAGITIKPNAGDADSFLNSLLPQDGFAIDFDLTIGISASQGVYFGGSGGLEISLPAHLQIGPIEIVSSLLTIKATPTGIPIGLGATIKGELGPLQAVVENIGLSANITFPAGNRGNLGPLNLGLGFQPPNGVGLSIDAGVVAGGGYLFFDFDKGEYAGALQLMFADFLALSAIGLVSTRMPDGSPGFSLLIIITAEFGTGLQLGYGFTLIGVGGLVGLNRTMLLQPLMEGVRTGAIDGIMFPRDVVANAPRIISDLRAIFPPAAGVFLIGPMAKLGWGTPTLISLALGIIIEIPGNIAILGVSKVALPTDDEAVLLLQVDFAGAIEFDKKRLYFFAVLFESRVLFIPIEGEMGLLAAFGDDANFVVSVGGFHPQFNPPPLPFPAPRRVSMSILNEASASIRVDGYFAVTTNTVQFGAHAELVFGFDSFGIRGEIAFDALFQFSPFYFIIELSASLSVNAFGVGLFSVRVRMSLEGPTPWRARGTGSISLLFFDISVDFDKTWGETRDTTLPPIAVMPLIHAEIDKADNWIAILPANNNLLVSLRKLPAQEGALVLHPVGTLRISQKAVPLNLVLDKVGTQKPSDVKRITLAVTAGGLAKTGDRLELFAPAQFRNMGDADKLSTPAFEPDPGGIELSAAGGQLVSSEMARRVVRYERIILDSNFKRQQRPFFLTLDTLFVHFLAGASVSRNDLSVTRKKQMQPFAEKVRVNAEAFTVAFQADNRAFGDDATSFTSRAQALDYLNRQVSANPDLADSLHVIPNFEVAA